ncbi:MAG: quinone-interacting membrane-bound oxidoreductase complex subunit QmoC [Thermodesulfovibrionales bacterium]|nr:quinone-interacting membrane-bound oxidoreductase complex subunit QmoC [Thermodesulfovibrionales bacterium]MCG2831570.1 quinone-interacting membrane-bound oxidoreductase complex subunit QmoC [Desulfobacteraceae bacterium]
MAEQVISPDLGFVKDIIAGGGESLKKCFQCATCSVVCNLAPDDKPFPRKEMIYAQWGLKDKLFANPDIWLCHQCSDCTAYCPRGAKPGEVLNAVRKLSIENYSVPSFLGKAVGSPSYLVLLLAVPVVILFIVLASLGHLNLSAIPRGEDGGIVYSKFMPEIYIEVIYIAISAFAAFIFALGIYRYWKDMTQAADAARWKMLLKGGLLSTIIAIIGEILLHKRFGKCSVTKDRQVSHLLVFYSFIGLAITAAWGVFYLYILKWESPYPLTDPLKWLGNASALALLIGITLVVRNRFKNKEKAGSGSYYDWLFIYIVFAIMATGILAQLIRLADIAVLSYVVYFAHLVVVFFLFAYAPFSKMAHMVYRATAMVFAKQAGRD